jgi:hypothetical protein
MAAESDAVSGVETAEETAEDSAAPTVENKFLPTPIINAA